MIGIVIIIGFEQERKTLVTLLSSEKDFVVLHAGTDGYDALMSASNLRPNIIIMDSQLSDIEGTDLAPLLKRRSPTTGLIVLSPQDEDIAAALRPEISGYLLKHADLNELSSSVRSVFYGGVYISARVRSRMFSIPPKYGAGTWYMLLFPQFRLLRAPVKLSATESQIFKGIVQGRSDREIAKELNMKTGSLRNCLSAVRRKTGLRNRSQMVLYALEYGSISFSVLQDWRMEDNEQENK